MRWNSFTLSTWTFNLKVCWIYMAFDKFTENDYFQNQNFEEIGWFIWCLEAIEEWKGEENRCACKHWHQHYWHSTDSCCATTVLVVNYGWWHHQIVPFGRNHINNDTYMYVMYNCMYLNDIIRIYPERELSSLLLVLFIYREQKFRHTSVHPL